MALSLKLGTAFTGANLPPIAYRDAGMNAGTLTLFDFTNSYCNPNADGILATGAAFNDLVPGGAGAAVVAGTGGGADRITSVAGKKGLYWATQSSTLVLDGVDFGAAERIDRTVGFTGMFWFTQDTTGNTGAYLPWIERSVTRGANANNSRWSIDSGSGGNNPRAQYLPDGLASGIGPNPPTTTSNLLTRGAVHMVGFSFIPSTSLTLFHDGVQILQQTASVPAALDAVTGSRLWAQLTGKGKIYRFLAENPTLSGRTAAVAIAAEWARLNGTFTA